MLRRLLALTVACLALTPAPARACWDGLLAESADVRLQLMGGAAGAWDPARVQAFATWLTRIDALAPDFLEVIATERDLTLFCDTCTNAENLKWDGDLATLFEKVARAVGADRKARRDALAQDATAYTVQIAAFATQAEADALALKLNGKADSLETHGFVQIGGFPAMNDTTHVVAVAHETGPVYRVLVGAFLSRADAEAAQTLVHAETSLRGFVRPLV